MVVLGATGGSGKEITKQALEKGYEVTAIARNPAAVAMHHPNLELVKGDVLQPASFEQELVGKQVVISCLGTGSNRQPTTVYSAGIENTISAMKKAGIRRLICISAGALDTNTEMGAVMRLLAKVVLQKMLRHLYADMRRMEAIVEANDIDWTIIRPARLTGKQFTGNYRTAIHAHLRAPWSIGRSDLAHFMLDSIENRKTFCAKVEIAY